MAVERADQICPVDLRLDEGDRNKQADLLPAWLQSQGIRANERTGGTGWGWRPLFWRNGVFGGSCPEGDQKEEI